MMQRRMTVARIPPVITTVPAVIRPTPHPTLQGDARRVRGSHGCHTGPGQGTLLKLSAQLQVGGPQELGYQGLPESQRVAVA